MATQLDRLEALAESKPSITGEEYLDIWDALPDLIRVARAAKAVQEAWDAYYDSGGDLKESQAMAWAEQVVRNALSPLYREVES